MTAGSSNVEDSSIADGTSLVTGGPFYRAVRRMGLSERRRMLNRIFVWLALTWLPLFLLCLAEGTAWGSKVKIPLLHDYSIYGRFLVALPLLLVAEVVIDPYIRRVLRTFNSSGIIGENDLPAYRAAVEKIGRWRDSGVIELFLALLAFFPFFLLAAEYEWMSSRVSTWHGTASLGLTRAGWWFVLVSSPFLRFLMLRWLWRYALWGYLLRRISRLNLALIPTHPDRLGGLGFLLFAQQQFGILAAALGSVLAGQFANEITHYGVAMGEVRAATAVYIAIAVLIVFLPLTLFSVKLYEARREALLRYSVVARGVTGRFDLKWVQTPEAPPGEMIGTQDPSSLIDYISSYEVIQGTKVILITRGAILHIAAVAAAPFALVWYLATPIDELIKEILKRLL
jgi:hypothetical protein